MFSARRRGSSGLTVLQKQSRICTGVLGGKAPGTQLGLVPGLVPNWPVAGVCYNERCASAGGQSNRVQTVPASEMGRVRLTVWGGQGAGGAALLASRNAIPVHKASVTPRINTSSSAAANKCTALCGTERRARPCARLLKRDLVLDGQVNGLG